MKRRWLGWSMSTLLLACAGPAQVRETVAYSRVSPSSSSTRTSRASTTKAAPARKAAAAPSAAGSPKTGPEATPGRKTTLRPTHQARVGGELDEELVPGESEAEREERKIDVGGIEGTMSEYDVKVTLDSRSGDFDRCHDEPGHSGSGRIKFRIRILPNGDVSDVNVRSSSVRNRNLVGCYSDVIMNSRFPSPHGGYADVTWSTKVGRSRKRPDEFFERKVRWDAPSSSSSGVYESGGASRDEDRRSDRQERRRRRHSRRHRSDG